MQENILPQDNASHEDTRYWTRLRIFMTLMHQTVNPKAYLLKVCVMGEGV